MDTTIDIRKNIYRVPEAAGNTTMAMENAALKYQNAAFKEEVTRLSGECVALRQKNEELESQVALLKTAIEFYEGQARQYRHELFGQSSEKTQAGCAQKAITEEKEAGCAEADARPKADPYDSESKYLDYDVRAHKRHKRVGKREDDLSGLSVERIDYELLEGERGCPCCGRQMEDIGVEVRRELVFVPAQHIVREHATHKYACRGCECCGGGTTVVEAEAPAPLISRSLASPSAVAYISVQKYVYCVPLYRMEKGFERDGFFLSRQTMANWLIVCVDMYLYKVYIALMRCLLKESVLHSDATPHQVLHEEGRDAKAKSYEWLYRTTGCADHQILVFEYTQTKGRENPEKSLKGFSGLLHCDGDATYHDLDGVTAVGCWSHSRRKFHNVIKALPNGSDAEGSYADRAMACINYLFHLEKRFKSLSPEDRYIKRLELSVPIAENFFYWAKAVEGLVMPAFPIGKAIGYALNQKEYLMNVFLDGRLEFTNNRAERSIRTFVLGKKNWLFSNTPDGAYASSVIYSVVGTALENGLDPYRYIVWLLEAMQKNPVGGAEALLPWCACLPGECRSRAQWKGAGQNEEEEHELYD